MHLLEAVADAAAAGALPAAAGRRRGALGFAMTEPAPGAGSDPTMLLTTARRRRRATGSSTGASTSSPARRAARSTSAWRAPPRRSATTRARRCSSSTPTTPGVRVERLIPTMDRAFSGGHAEVTFDDCRVPADAVLGEAGPRLPLRPGAARAGAADALHALARPRAARARHRARPAPASARHSARRCSSTAWCRRSSPTRVIDIEASRGLIRTCAEVLDAGGRGSARIVRRQGLRLRGGRARRRPLAADLRRPRRQRRPPAGALCARGAGLPDLRRPERDAPLVDRAARRAPPPARAVSGPVDVVDTPSRRRRCRCRRSSCCGPLEAWLDAHGLGSGRPDRDAHRRRATPTRRSCSSAASERMVLRRAPRPPLPPSAHDMLREARVLRALARPRARAARARRLCRRPTCSASPFYVMEELRGHVVTERAARRRSRAPSARRAAGHDLVDALVELHAVDIERRGAGRLRPSRRLPRAPAAALRGALGAQRDARAAARRRARGVARAHRCRAPARPASCTATTGSAT